MIVSLYRNAYDDRPTPRDLARFEDLSTVLGDSHDVKEPNEKGKTPNTQHAFSAAEFDGKGRKIPNVTRVHFGAIDVDKKTPQHVARALDKFRALRSFVYSTFSHGTAPGVSLRWLFPFSRPIEVHGDPKREWEPYIAGFQALTDNLIDTEKDPTRLFFVPTARPEFAEAPDGTPGKPFLLYTPGEGDGTLNVDAVISLGRQILSRHGALVPPTHEATPDAAFTLTDLKDVATTCKRSKSAAIKGVGQTLAAIAAGQVYTHEPNRDDSLFRACGQIAEFFPSADPETIAALFVASIGATNAFHKSGDDYADTQKVIEKIARLQEKVRARLAVKAEEHEKEQRAEISAAFAALGIQREHPYTEEEIEQIKTDVGATSYEELSKSWIIQHGTAYYLQLAGQYLAPVPEKSLATAARRDLAPAITAGVRLTEIDADGNAVPLARDVILARHATAARRTIVDLGAQRTTYDRETQTITEAPCPLREIAPKHEPAIDEWIAAVGGDAANSLRRWIGYVTLLDRPCVAVYLDGDPGVGKTLLAKALSRLWTKAGPTSLKDALRDFNDAIMRCPFVLADEALPKDMLGEGTATLREYQQNTTRKVNRKGLPIADMVGAIRLVLCSNNKNMIETNEALTNVDIDAITERILYIRAKPRAREILQSWGDAQTARLVTDDLLAAHALWLRDNVIAPDGRFLIKTHHGHSALSRTLTTHSGDRSIVCHWLVSYLQAPTKYDMRHSHLCHIREGALHVNAEALTVDWELYVTNAKAPRTSRLSQALTGLARPERKQVRIHGERVNFHVIDTENLIVWAEETGISSREQIEGALQKPTVISGRAGITVARSPFATKEGSKL